MVVAVVTGVVVVGVALSILVLQGGRTRLKLTVSSWSLDVEGPASEVAAARTEVLAAIQRCTEIGAVMRAQAEGGH